MEFLDLLGLGQLGQRINQIFKELLFVLEVLSFFFLNLDLDNCLEFSHNLVSRNLAALVLSHLIG